MGNVSGFFLIRLVCCHFARRCIRPEHPLQDHWSITHIASSLFVVSLSPCFVSTVFSFFFLLVFPPSACTLLELPPPPSFPLFSSTGFQRSLPPFALSPLCKGSHRWTRTFCPKPGCAPYSSALHVTRRPINFTWTLWGHRMKPSTFFYYLFAPTFFFGAFALLIFSSTL